MCKFSKIVTGLLPMVFRIFNNYRTKNVAGIVLLFVLFANNLFASPPGYPASYTPAELLTKLLKGEYKTNQQAVRWSATAGDIHEFNGQLGEQNVLYSFIDTTMTIDREGEKIYYTIFHTSPMVINEEGEFVNPNNCHVCGVNLGYFSYIIENDSIYIQKFKRNFATHGSFGEKSYDLSMINLGNGYELLKVDDPYEGMGTASVATRFYQDGELMLSMISNENNRGNRAEDQKGYYEFKTDYAYNNKAHTITVKQTGYRIDEQSGRKIQINKTKKLLVDNYTLHF
ncbi:hypothetical protein [Pedobacter flavus]|uniref:Uncharacterized protein n=1 Tax=Pedobacter flavus TaxID=3113906 RepID=A0ABU7GYP6_9SPHI|nr:hypothetical protein [Pedobacter sp. VNH31]MEE1884210.1 hypothetical protein [Pedobacter sp. VNH31]